MGNLLGVPVAPAHFVDCVANQLPAPTRKEVSHITDDDEGATWRTSLLVTDAGLRCDRAFVVAAWDADLLHDDSGPSLDASQAACTSAKALANVAGVNPEEVSAASSTDTADPHVAAAFAKALDACVPVWPALGTLIKSADPSVTEGQ
jgi:hypothetical protein